MSLPRRFAPTLAPNFAFVRIPLRCFNVILFAFVVLSQVQCKGTTGIRPYILANTHKRLTTLIEHIFQAYYNTLKVHLTTLLDIIADFSQIYLRKSEIFQERFMLDQTMINVHDFEVNIEQSTKVPQTAN